MWATNAEIRARRDAEWGVPCTCPPNATLWDAFDCARHLDEAYLEAEAMQAAEIAAENAWLHAAEQSTPDDWAFEQYERDMGLY